MIRFHIVIPVHNRLTRTVTVLGCLQRQTYQDFTVYVIDDGSTDGTAERVSEEFGSKIDLRILFGDGNLWWSGATHLGIDAALQNVSDEDVIVMMNDDIEFDEDFLERALAIAVQYPDSIFGPLVIDDRDRSTIRLSGSVMKSWPLAITYHPLEYCNWEQDVLLSRVFDVDFLGAKATFVPVKVIRHIGNVNAELLPHYHSDGEYSYRAKRAGYRVFICRDIAVYHSVETTGSLNNFAIRPSLVDILKSLTDIRSPNNIKYRINFARLCCPPIFIVPFLFSDTMKMVVRSLGNMFLGKRVVFLRVLVNRILQGKMNHSARYDLDKAA